MIEIGLIFTAFIILACVLLNNASFKMGIPMLLAFMLLGILFGNNGLIPLRFDNYEFAENVSTIALIFIMFYGGFGTRWKSAKPVATASALLASLGVVFTAALTGVFCRSVLHWDWLESLLMGAVVGSTDAASVFSILRSRKLGLKNNTAPLLEVESGSNDPFSYMLTILLITLINGGGNAGEFIWMLIKQLAFGAGFGVLIAWLTTKLLRRMSFSTSGFDSLFMLAVALFSYAIPSSIGGNGYLSAYLAGIIIGNADFPGKKNLVGFFDGLTGLMQVIIFFMLGLLAHPDQMHKVIVPALAIFMFMLIVARPVTVGLILGPFRKFGFKQQLYIALGGLRGAASIVFAIIAVVACPNLEHDILNVVFCIVLLSIALQGSLLPWAAKKLDMVDKEADVMKTFNDFSEETDLYFSEIVVGKDNPWLNLQIKDIVKPRNMLFCLVIHADGSSTVPNGDTVLVEDDRIIMCTKAFRSEKTLKLIEHTVEKDSKHAGKPLRDYDTGKNQVVLIKRKDDNIIPNGDTVILPGDILFLNIAK